MRIDFTGGGRSQVQFFALGLKYSRYTSVTLVPDQRVESLLRALAADFCRFGGVPLLAVFDSVPHRNIYRNGQKLLNG